ncbi:MAG: hypothetical protein WC552_01525, partial [Candidatus Omnitrophota bacterium]
MNNKNVLQWGASAFLIGMLVVFVCMFFYGVSHLVTYPVILISGWAFLAGVGILIALYKNSITAFLLAATVCVWNFESFRSGHPLLEVPFGRAGALILAGLALLTCLSSIFYNRS